MKIKKGLALFLAMTLGFSPVMVSAEELAPDEDATTYYKHVITLEKKEITTEPGTDFTLATKVISTDVTAEVVDPDTYKLNRNEVLTVGDKYSCDFIWGFEKEGIIDFDKPIVNGENKSPVTISAPDAPGTYKYVFMANTTGAGIWNGFNDYQEPGVPDLWYLVEPITVIVEEAVPVDSVTVTKITLDPTAKTLVPGESFEIKSTVEPKDATNPALKWSSSDEKVATVKDGKVTAVAAGTAKITAEATDGSKVSAACDVTVSDKETEVESVTLDKETVTLIPGKSVTLKATVKPEGVVPKELKWSSSKKKVATVKDGKVTAVAPGTAKITVNADGKTAEATIKVASMELDTNNLVLQNNKSKKIGGTFVNDKIKSAVVSKDKDDVIENVTTSANGKSVTIKASKKKTGTAYVKVTSKAGIKATIKVKVQKAKVKTKKVEILNKDGKAKNPFTVKTGKKLTLTIKATPDQVSTGDTAKITKNTNKKVASAEIKDGKLVVKGKKKGEAKITVKVGSKKKTIKIKVKNK